MGDTRGDKGIHNGADIRTTAERERDALLDRVEALEGQVARVTAEVAHWRKEWIPTDSGWVEACADAIDAALDPDPADRGTGRDGEGS